MGTWKIDTNITHLENPIFIKQNKSGEFNHLKKKKIASKTQGWKSKFLSSAGKAILIISECNPKLICKKVDFWFPSFDRIQNFDSNRYCALKEWKTIYKPKEMGGLGN